MFNNFLPYGFAGLAWAAPATPSPRLVDGQQNAADCPVCRIIPCDPAITPTCVDYSFSNSAGKTNTILYGFSVGGGIDVALTQNIFVRGEYEYIQFAALREHYGRDSAARVSAPA